MDGACGDEGVDTTELCALYRFAGGFDIFF